MSKRFTDTEIWDDDWFYELSPEYKLFWFYIKDNCNYAGIWKPKVRSFQALSDVEINLDNALKYFNFNKQRVRLLKNGYWFLEDFFYFQYVKTSKSINLNSRVHKSIFDIYRKMDIPISSVKGLDFVISENGEQFDAYDYENMIGKF